MTYYNIDLRKKREFPEKMQKNHRSSENDDPISSSGILSTDKDFSTDRPVFEGAYQQNKRDRRNMRREGRLPAEGVWFDKGDEIDYDAIAGNRKEGYEDVRKFAERNGYAKEFVRADPRENAAWRAL